MAGRPPGELMQRAAFGLATITARLLRERFGRVHGLRLAVVAGSGNNGGDALYAAAALAGRGVSVDVVQVGDRIHSEGLAAVLRAGGRLGPARPADAVLDAVVGIGGSGPLREAAAAVRDRIGAALTIAVDLPSGVDADTGWVAGEVFRADHTVTFGCLKPGLVVPPGAAAAGEVHLVDIGLALPEPQVGVVEPSDVAAAFRRPGPEDNKYTRGVVGVAAGSARYPGAGLLCLAGARHGGAGMVRYDGPNGDRVVLEFPDVVAGPGRTDAWVVGPGLADPQRLAEALDRVLSEGLPAVLDAEAITALAEDADLRQRLTTSGAPVVLTPHEGEFARLGFEVGQDRIGAVRAAAAGLGACVLLKGAVTVVASPTGRAFINRSSSYSLATAGSGDVLSGLLGAALAAQRGSLDHDGAARLAAVCALVHARAGARAVWPATATDVAAAVPGALRDLVPVG